MGRLALLAQLATTLPLVGLIWMVQVVVYPQLARVGPAEFLAYHAAHTRLITPVVGPLMVGELLAAVAFLAAPTTGTPPWLPAIGLGLVAACWGTTVFLSVPQHELLGRGFQAAAWGRLTATNWVRTVAWTVRGALLLWLVARSLARAEG